MVYRNLMSMGTEEMIGAQPMDAVVLIGGCDKTVPAQLMGAASADLPAVQLVTGPMSLPAARARDAACQLVRLVGTEEPRNGWWASLCRRGPRH